MKHTRNINKTECREFCKTLVASEADVRAYRVIGGKMRDYLAKLSAMNSLFGTVEIDEDEIADLIDEFIVLEISENT
jgi:dissimilatory sulfite reductase (desulfoviridin) alpha/beta subunit